MGKRFDKEFKLHAIKLVLEEENSIAEIAWQFDLLSKTLHRQVSNYKEDPIHSFVGSENLRPEEQALREAQKRIRDLEEENSILKKAMNIIVKNQK